MDGNIMKTINILLLSFAFSLPCVAQIHAQATEQQQDVSLSSAPLETRMASYREGIKQADPAIAKKFLADKDAVSQDEQKNRSVLKAQAMALVDLRMAMDKNWKAENINDVYKILLNRIGTDKVLTASGVGPQPEKVIPWLLKYLPKRYTENEVVYDKDKNPSLTPASSNTRVVKHAIRNWEMLFDNAQSRSYEWDGVPLTVTKQEWDNMSLMNRNATLKKIGMYLARLGDSKYLYYNEEAVDMISVQSTQMASVNQALQSNILTEQQRKEINDARTPAEKAYLLNKFFDGSNVKYSDDIRMGVNANRSSTPNEGFDSANRQLMTSMLRSSIASELKGTSAGNRALSGGLKIEIAYCDSGYSQLKDDGTIVLDEETIQQYMRLKGYTSASVLSDRNQLSEIAKYMAPAVVYESAHRDQQKWAKANGAYKPATQEDEIDAMSAEAYYVAEKMQKDESFYNTFTGVEKYSKYAAKRVENATSYTQGKKVFADNVRAGSQNLPTVASAKANLINLVNEELSRRAALTAEEREMEYQFIAYNEVMTMTPDQIRSSIRDIEEGALTRLLESLNSGAYSKYNHNAVAKTRAAYNTMMSGGEKKTGSAIPLPGTK